LQGWPRRALLAVLIAVTGLSLAWFAAAPEAEPPPPPPPEAPKSEPAVRENLYLRQSQVACRSQQALEEITRLAQDRQRYVKMLSSGSCFVSRNDIALTGLKSAGGSILEGRGASGELLYFHDFSLRREMVRENQ
jgi:hypothetical protein